MSTSPLLEIKELRIAFGRSHHSAVAVNNVSLDLGVGEVVGLVGESGSGKSLTCRSTSTGVTSCRSLPLNCASIGLTTSA